MKAIIKLLIILFVFVVIGFHENRFCGNAQGQSLGFEARSLARASQATTTLTSSVSQYGITWQFDGNYLVGTFANGDYWVVGPVTIARITPDYDGAHNGWQVNPLPGERQGFEKGGGEYFDPSLVPPLPYLASPGESIVKVISINQNPNNSGDCFPLCLQTAAVLTVVAAPPPDNGAAVFRPPYVGAEKPYYKIADFKTDLLPTFKPVPFTPALKVVERRFQRVQFDHIGSYAGRILRPRDNVLSDDPYQPPLAKDIADAALRFMLDDSISEKMTALTYYVQYGIDLYHAVLNGQTWRVGGGYEPGHKLPLTFAAVMLDHEGMKQAVMSTDFWNEDEAIIRGKNGVVLFGFKPIADEMDYWDHIRNDPGYALEFPDPYGYIDGGRPPDEYQFCCMSLPWKSSALAIYLMPAMRPVWNDEAFFEYADRWVEVGTWTQPDPCAPAKGVFGVDFGPDGKGDCIKDKDPRDGVGRFPSAHGANKDQGFNESDFAREMWKAYRELVRAGFFIIPADLPRAKENAAYEYTLQARNGQEPYSWSVDSSKLPNGIELSAFGIISGTPIESGKFDFIVKVTDSDSQSATQVMSLIVDPDLPLSAGLISYWPFNESAQTVAHDQMGINPGTLINGPIWRPNGGKIDGALEFDGVDDLVDIGTMDIANGTGMTIAFWFKADVLNDRDARFISKATGVSDQDHYWMVSLFDSSALRLRLKTAGVTTTLVSAAGEITTNKWYHVAVTYDGSQMRIFKNSVEIASAGVSGSIDTNPNVKAAIGNQPSAAGSNPFVGLIDDMRVFNRALSLAEIKELYSITTTELDATPRGAATPPKEYQLGQNFPNPFNPSTTIPFYLPKTGFVTLKICDITGREIAVLVNEVMPAGSHQIQLTTNRLPSGLYFYTLKAGQFKQTKTLLLLN